MQWTKFAAACPDIAELAEQRFRKDEVVLVGTLRKDGSPRIGPNEVDFAKGHLFSLDVESVGYTVFGEGRHALAWDPERGLRRLPLH